MTYLAPEQIQEIHRQAMATPGLMEQWRNMLSGIPIEYTSQLRTDSSDSIRLYAQLDAMNNVSVLKGGVVPLERWLKNAAYFSDQFPDSAQVFQKYALIVAEKRALAIKAQPSNAQPAQGSGTAHMDNVPEKIIFVNDMVSFGFLAAASRVGKSVARLTVPRFQGGQPVTWTASTEQMKYFGTGWLIGPKHIITNHHVVNARNTGEADATQADFERQGKETTVQFDYDQQNAAGDIRVVKAVVAANKTLDYTILELSESTGREPLTLNSGKLVLPTDSYVPVNLIQHPGGQPKKLGFRNNVVAAINDNDIAYFTDTEPGSSGSPVCTDLWQVVGLHKASSVSFGEFEFQGKKTAWVNVGTRIDKILSDLKQNHADLWHVVGAVVIS